MTNLGRLMQGLEVDWGTVSPELKVASVVCDSRLAGPGDVFVAIPGIRQDGCRFAASAMERGAVAVVSEKPCPGFDRPLVLVKDARAALAHMACIAYNKPSSRLSVVGVTGTNGKTTTSCLIASCLRAAGLTAGTITTVAVEIGDRVIPAVRTTPDAPSLQRLLADMDRVGCRAAVMEVSSHALDQKRTAGTRFAVGVFTNLTRDHLDYHGSMEKYFMAKKIMFDQLATPGGVAVVNADDPWGRRLLDELPARGILVRSYGLTSGEARVRDLSLASDGSSFDLLLDGGVYHVNARLPGRYNVYNMLAALLAAQSAGVPVTLAAETIASFAPCWGRLEKVDDNLPGAPAVFVDYAHTDDALNNVLQTVREITQGKVVVVFGCGGDRDPGKRPMMGRAAARWSDLVVITSDNPRSEDPAAIIRQIVDGLPPDCNYRICQDRRQAIALALAMAGPGDSVVVAGKGHETYQELANTVMPFDDREIVRKLLRRERSGK